MVKECVPGGLFPAVPDVKFSGQISGKVGYFPKKCK